MHVSDVAVCGAPPGVNLQTHVCALCQEFEIELEGSQTLKLLCYEKCCNKNKQGKEDGESTDKIMAKGKIKVLLSLSSRKHLSFTGGLHTPNLNTECRQKAWC